LMGLGIEAHLQAIQADPATTFEDYTLVRSALMRLLDPAAMGRFRVMAFSRDLPVSGPSEPPLGLFAFRLPNRRGR
jgi:SAM-dependent MidA family methyltransferase